MLSFEIGVVGCLAKILNSVNYGDCFKSLIGIEYFDIDVYRCTILGLHAIYIYTKFGYKLGCSLKLQFYSISFYWIWILTNPSLDYIFFLHPLYLQNFQKIKNKKLCHQSIVKIASFCSLKLCIILSSLNVHNFITSMHLNVSTNLDNLYIICTQSIIEFIKFYTFNLSIFPTMYTIVCD